MKKVVAIIVAVLSIFVCIYCGTAVYATTENNTLNNESTGQLIQIKENELKSIDDYKVAYGSDTYGITAYILNKVRVYSIPLVFIGIAISAIYQYVIGIRKLDVRDKGFSTMIAIITIGVICQVLPLIFTIVVKLNVS